MLEEGKHTISGVDSLVVRLGCGESVYRCWSWERGAHGTVYTIKVSCEFYDALSENGVDGLYKAGSRG